MTVFSGRHPKGGDPKGGALTPPERIDFDCDPDQWSAIGLSIEIELGHSSRFRSCSFDGACFEMVSTFKKLSFVWTR